LGSARAWPLSSRPEFEEAAADRWGGVVPSGSPEKTDGPSGNEPADSPDSPEGVVPDVFFGGTGS
jgi:hypothetical protein